MSTDDANDTPERDYNAEMNELILTYLRSVEGDFVPSIAAWNLATDLDTNDPELLNQWLRLHAKSFITQLFTTHLRSWRAKARSKASVFGKSATEFEKTGDASVLGGWFNIRYVVDDQSTQRRLGDMTREDLEFVASRFGRTAQTLLLEEAFHRALAARVGSRTVADVFTEDQISAMYRGLRNKTNIAAS